MLDYLSFWTHLYYLSLRESALNQELKGTFSFKPLVTLSLEDLHFFFFFPKWVVRMKMNLLVLQKKKGARGCSKG